MTLQADANTHKRLKFVLGFPSLKVLEFIHEATKLDVLLSYLVKEEIVTAKSSAEKVIRNLIEKGFLKEEKGMIELTEAGELLKRALMLARVIKERSTKEG